MPERKKPAEPPAENPLDFASGMEKYAELLNERDEKAPDADAPPESGVRMRKDDAQATEDLSRIETALQRQLYARAELTGTTVEAQEEILELQEKKQQIMKELREDIAALDDPEAKERASWKAKKITMRGSSLRTIDDAGKEIKVTLGDIVTDGVWDVEYALDKKTVPRVLRKRYLVERARYKLEQLFDQQIITERQDSNIDEGLHGIYEKVRERQGKPEQQFGIIAERIVAQMARKMIIDGEIEGFRFESANVHEDVERAVDFIIRRSSHGRGVKVQPAGGLEAVGLQVTIRSGEEDLQKKQRRIDSSKRKLTEEDRIDDIALAQVDETVLSRAWSDYKLHGGPGGPDRYLPREFRRQLFKGLVRGMRENPGKGSGGSSDAPPKSQRKKAA